MDALLEYLHTVAMLFSDTFFFLFMDFMIVITVGNIWILPFLLLELDICCSAAGGWSFYYLLCSYFAGAMPARARSRVGWVRINGREAEIRLAFYIQQNTTLRWRVG